VRMDQGDLAAAERIFREALARNGIELIAPSHV